VIINALIEIRNDFAFPAEDPANDTELQAKNRETLSRCGDIQVQPGLWKTRVQGPRSWQVYSLLYEVDARQQFEQAIERFKSENPGQTDVLGAWHVEDGRQVGIETDGSGVPLYPIPGRFADFMPDDPDGTPNPTLRDVNLYYGQAPRQFT
jgi:hypothetical protein